MATSSLLGIDAENLPTTHSPTGIDSLGPSDASDSGSDSAGAYGDEPDSDTDRFGTGERSSAEPDERQDPRDILPDHVEALTEDPSETGSGLDPLAERSVPDQPSHARAGGTRLDVDQWPGMTDEDENEDDATAAGE